MLACLHDVRSLGMKTKQAACVCMKYLCSSQFDVDGNGHITVTEIGMVLKALGESVPGYMIRNMIKEVDLDENGTVEFDEFLEVFKCMQHPTPADS